jgi:hypothetical protein
MVHGRFTSVSTSMTRWTYLYAVGTAPALPREAHRGPLAGSGRGIPIIKALAATTWVGQAGHGKTIHVVMTRTGVELTPEDKPNPHALR